MTTIDLKSLLIHRIAAINDESFLNAIKAFLDSKTQSQTLNLTDNQRLEIYESKSQIENGLFIEQSELDKEFKKWSSAK